MLPSQCLSESDDKQHRGRVSLTVAQELETLGEGAALANELPPPLGGWVRPAEPTKHRKTGCFGKLWLQGGAGALSVPS